MGTTLEDCLNSKLYILKILTSTVRQTLFWKLSLLRNFAIGQPNLPCFSHAKEIATVAAKLTQDKVNLFTNPKSRCNVKKCCED